MSSKLVRWVFQIPPFAPVCTRQFPRGKKVSPMTHAREGFPSAPWKERHSAYLSNALRAFVIKGAGTKSPLLTQGLSFVLWHSFRWEHWLHILFAVSLKHTGATDEAPAPREDISLRTGSQPSFRTAELRHRAISLPVPQRTGAKRSSPIDSGLCVGICASWVFLLIADYFLRGFLSLLSKMDKHWVEIYCEIANPAKEGQGKAKSIPMGKIFAGGAVLSLSLFLNTQLHDTVYLRQE